MNWYLTYNQPTESSSSGLFRKRRQSNHVRHKMINVSSDRWYMTMWSDRSFVVPTYQKYFGNCSRRRVITGTGWFFQPRLTQCRQCADMFRRQCQIGPGQAEETKGKSFSIVLIRGLVVWNTTEDLTELLLTTMIDDRIGDNTSTLCGDKI